MNNPLEVKRVIASETCANTVRQGLVTAYNHYMNFCGLSWEIPSYQREDYEIQVPLEENLNLIIGSATRVTAMKFLLMKEGGLRPIEIYKVEVRDFGFERKPLAVRTAKGSKGITARLIESTVQMIKDYVPIKGPALDDFLSRGSTDTLRPLFTESRRKAALKLSKPELLKIFPSSHV